MVDLTTKNKQVKNKVSEQFSILILGKGATNYKNGQITKVDSSELAKYYYGDSELTYAFNEAFNIGADNIFLCNCYIFTDYINVLDTIVKGEYDFICPLFNFSETYRNKQLKQYYLAELYSTLLGNMNTTIIFTDKKASLFESIEDYITYTKDNIFMFKQATNGRLEYAENICFVANNLTAFKYANVALASVFAISELNKYPQCPDLGDVDYDLAYTDFYNDVCYFAFNERTRTSVEHLMTFNKKQCPEKYIPIRLIIQKINKVLTYEQFAGRLFTKYTEIELQNYISDNMNSLIDVVIKSWRLKDYYFIRSKNEKGVLTGYVELAILPFNSIEEILITMEI